MMFKDSHFIKVQIGYIEQVSNPHSNCAVLGCNSIWLCGKELAARWKLVELERRQQQQE